MSELDEHSKQKCGENEEIPIKVGRKQDILGENKAIVYDTLLTK